MEKNKKSERISKVIARSTPYSRRQVEQLIYDGTIRIDGKIIDKPSINVSKENIVQFNAGFSYCIYFSMSRRI